MNIEVDRETERVNIMISSCFYEGIRYGRHTTIQYDEKYFVRGKNRMNGERWRDRKNSCWIRDR